MTEDYTQPVAKIFSLECDNNLKVPQEGVKKWLWYLKLMTLRLVKTP